MRRLLLLNIACFVLAGCSGASAVKIEKSATPEPPSTASPQRQVDLTKIGHIAPKGRVQDRDYNQLPVIDELIGQRKEAIRFLISKLGDETKINTPVMDYWGEVRVGDVALIILTNFFTDSTWQRSTVAGVGWDEFLKRGNRTELTGEQVLRSYIARHGRKDIQQRWQRIFAQHGSNLYWDDKERCFRPRTS